jgi:ribosomal protein L27
MRGTKQYSGGVMPTARLLPTTRGTKQYSGGVMPTARLLPTTRGTKQHSGDVVPTARLLPTTARLLPTTRGTKQHSGDAVLPLAGRSLLNLLRGLLRSPLCLITRLLPHRLPPRLRQRRRPHLQRRQRCLPTCRRTRSRCPARACLVRGGRASARQRLPSADARLRHRARVLLTT